MSQVEFRKKKGLAGFITSKDRYADPIKLTYNHEKVYKTQHGGILTCVAFVAILLFLTEHILNIIEVDFTSIEKIIPISVDETGVEEGFNIYRD